MNLRSRICTKWALLLASLGLAVAAPTAVAQGKGGGNGGGGSSEISVTVTMRDALDDKVISDGGGAYVNGTGGVRAVITSIGGLNLEPREDGNGVRQLFIRLDDEWQGGPLTCTNGSSEPCVFDRSNSQRTTFNVTMVVEDVCGSDAGLDGGLLAMSNGEQRCGRMAYWFSASPTEAAQAGKNFDWTERFRPGGGSDLTNDVVVTRLGANSWTVESARVPTEGNCPEAGDCSVLVRSKLAKGKAALIKEGFFHVPFLMTITRIP